MTADEAQELELLALAGDESPKFGIDIGCCLSQAHQEALERLQRRDWVRLSDITIVHGRMFRLFLLMPPAVEWLRVNRVVLHPPPSERTS